MEPSLRLHDEDEKPPLLIRQSIEERAFLAALSFTEAWFTGSPPIGPRTRKGIVDGVRKTMEMTLNRPEVREVLAKNVDIWMRLQLVFYYAIPHISDKSLREAYAETAPADFAVPETSTLIAENHATLVEDLNLLNNLLVIARNMLAIKEVAQDICAATQTDAQIVKLIILCVSVTSKGYDGENVDNVTRSKVNEVIELYKKLLVTSLQFLHNLTMGNDRLKMAFWFEMLFDNDLHNDTMHDMPAEDLRVDLVYDEVRNWLRRNWIKCPEAQQLIDQHNREVKHGHNAGKVPDDVFSLQDYTTSISAPAGNETALEAKDTADNGLLTPPIWSENEQDKQKQDQLYGRVSHEIDVWWKTVRDANYDTWQQTMDTVENAMNRAEVYKNNAMTRYIPQVEQDADLEFEHGEEYEDEQEGDEPALEDDDKLSRIADDGEDGLEGEEEEDDESYVEGPLRGLLTEIPNILDTKQIEALHMTVKACIVDAMGSGLTKAGENLQKTRCKMFLALDCGKNLLREMLVFIAVWEQAENQFIFQITAQIIESFHHNALLPYAWNSLRILKDIVSPAQTVLLRLINYMFRARKGTTIYNDVKDYNRDAKLIFFLYNYFRCRVVPDCIALIYAQAQIRNNEAHAQDFPVDLWDMERAKDGLSQYLDFISVIAEIDKMRPLLIEWETTYELLALLNALEAGVARKPLVEPAGKNNLKVPVDPNNPTTDAISAIERPYDTANAQGEIAQDGTPPASLPPLHDTPHKYPWTGIKVQIMMIFASLVQPLNKRSGPGNPIVQKQIMKYNGIMPLLNCCVYDGHNEYLKERATIALKWVMEGCAEAQNFVRDLSPLKNQNPSSQQARGQAPVETMSNEAFRAQQAKERAANASTQSSAGRVSEVTEDMQDLAVDGKK